MSRLAIATCSLLVFCSLGAARAAAQDFDPDEWLARCRHEDWNDNKEKFCEVRQLGMRSVRGTLTIDPDQNGGVHVSAWDRDSIGVFAKIKTWGRTTDDARALARDVKIEAAGTAIRATGPGTRSRYNNWSVEFEVFVPRQTNLAVHTENGPLAVEGVKGVLDLSAENGPVSLSGVAGAVKARVLNGPLSVDLEGDHWDGDGLDAEAENGPVDLAIPAGYSARLETGTINGPMTLGFPLTVTVQGRITQRISTTLGSGGALVRVVTTNGPFVLRRRR